MQKPAFVSGRASMGLVALVIVVAAVCTPNRNQPAATRASVASLDSLEREYVSPGLGTRLDSRLSEFESQGFSGTVLIVHRRRIVLAKGYGFANKEARVRNSPATRFELNSQTKMFTAAAILQLAGEGKLAITDPLERHLGRFPEEKRGATIEQLASHTSGVAVAGADVFGGPRDVFVTAMKAAPVEAAPGTKYRYTNAGYSLLAALIEVTAGMKYEDYLRQHVFAAAKMRYATFRNEVPANDTLFARGYGAPDSANPPGMNPYQWGTIGAGGVWSTMGDLYRWIIAVEEGDVVPKHLAHLLATPPKPPSREAFGWHVYPATDSLPRRIEKGGGSDVFASHLLRFPDEQIVILWASNDLTKRWRQDVNRAITPILLQHAREERP